MRKIELLPTEENLFKTYMEDTIGRNKCLHYFLDMLYAMDTNYSIAVDGSWGSGKTFFIKQARMILDSLNEKAGENKSEYDEQIRARYLGYRPVVKESKPTQYVTVYYDAWENDNDDDPLLSLIYQIVLATEMRYKFDRMEEKIVGVLTAVVDGIANTNISSIPENIEKKSLFAEYDKRRSFSNQIKEFLKCVLDGRGERLVIFIDELDRCKPSFAVSLLERIKHYFSDEQITFVFSVNACELNKTICHYYGGGFSATRYLDRFFDIRLALPKANLSKFFSTLSIPNSRSTLYMVMEKVISTYHFNLREITKLLFAVEVSVKKYLKNNLRYSMDDYYDYRTKKFCTDILVPVLVGLKMYDSALYQEFLNGETPQPLIDCIVGIEYDVEICAPLLSNNEVYEGENWNRHDLEKCSVVTVQDKLHQFYEKVFADGIKEPESTSVGKLYITHGTKVFVEEVANMLSEFTDFISDAD